MIIDKVSDSLALSVPLKQCHALIVQMCLDQVSLEFYLP